MSKQNKTISFLYEASKILPKNPIYTAIRSRMLVKCSEINPSNSLTLDVVPRCIACGIVFKDVPPSIVIQSVKKPKCYNKIKNSERITTKYQVLRYKNYNKYKNDKQKLITQCKLCKKQSTFTLNKTGHKRPKKSQTNPLEETAKKKKLKNIQRKKNREFSGLKKSAVLSAKRSLETETNNNRSPKKLKTNHDVINLITPESKKTKNKIFSTPNLHVLSPNTINKKLGCTSTPFNANTDIICLGSPKKQTFNNIFTPIASKTNKTIIEISDTEAQGNNTGKKKKKRNRKKNKSVQKNRVNNNIVLVGGQSASDKKKKKLNNLSMFLKNATNIQQTNKTNKLQTFLSSLT